ncbi:MAG: TIM barrel protein [Armatimonadia bacterium]|nr:TIM barrel protein [Armatimonadia bacterium]
MTDIKLACAAWGFREMSLPEYFEAVKEMGIDYVEVNLGPNSPGHLAFDASDGDLDRALQAAEDAGVQIVALAGGNNFAADDLDAEIAKVNRQIEMCEALGAEVLRIFAGWVGAADYTDATFERVSDGLEQVGKHAGAHGVMVAMENHGGITATGAQCSRLLTDALKADDTLIDFTFNPAVSAMMGPPTVGLNYDPANFRHAGEDPLSALMVTADLINYSHWKDVRYVDGEPEYCAVGEGVIDWAPIVEDLLASGFDGYWAIEYEETEDILRGTRDSAEYIRETLAAMG